jgi:DNA modification methylase
MDWRHLAELLEASEQTELGYLNLLVWAKTNAGMGSFYRSAHEMIGVFKYGEAPHRNNVELGRHGRNRTNVLHYPGANTFAKGRKKALELHPTVKPVALIADLILDSSGPGELILDPFGGSGTTLMAAEKTDRIAALVEIDPTYVDVTIRRFEAATGEAAIHEETGLSFAELVAHRAEGRA